MTIEDLVADVLQLPRNEVSDSFGPAISSAWTSLRHVQIVNAMQREYGVRFAPREIRSIRTVGDLRRLLVSKGVGL
jgi:acyl carrier protein